MSETSTDESEQYCPWCEEFTRQVLIQYEPTPNAAQTDADGIPTDELQLAVGTLCCECGDLISVHVAAATRSTDSTTEHEEVTDQ